jgi:hypothetical protein
MKKTAKLSVSLKPRQSLGILTERTSVWHNTDNVLIDARGCIALICGDCEHKNMLSRKKAALYLMGIYPLRCAWCENLRERVKENTHYAE